MALKENSPAQFPAESWVSTPLLKEAYACAKTAHQGQHRKSGEEYFTHCLTTTQFLVDWGITDENLLSACLLHDVVEDTNLTLDQLKSQFGEEIAFLVDGVTKLKSADISGEEETLKKIVSMTYMDPRVALIKLADRLHNLSTISSLPAERQRAIAKETLDVYAGLAESLGIWIVKTQMEDLAYSILFPDEFQRIKKEIDNDPRLDNDFCVNVRTNIERLLLENKINGVVEVRKGGYLDLKEKRRKAAMAGKSTMDNFRDIEDVVSFRIRLKKLPDCYQVVGVIHREYGPQVVYSLYDEFVGSHCRINGYEAIQTTVSFENKGLVEIAIVTNDAEEFNNWGVVSLINRGQKDLKEFALKMIFTPTGEVKFLPRRSTGIDFAYSLNPRLGAEAIGLKIDGVEAPLSTVLPNACNVEIVVGEPRRAPDRSALDYCLPATKRIIEMQLAQQERDEMIEKGKSSLGEPLSTRGLLSLEDVAGLINPTVYHFGCQGLDDLYFKLGGGNITHEQLSVELDRWGITKEKLGMSGLEVYCINDQPGILNRLSTLILELQGNITNVRIRTDSDGRVCIQISMKGMGSESEKTLGEKLSSDSLFSRWRIV